MQAHRPAHLVLLDRDNVGGDAYAALTTNDAYAPVAEQLFVSTETVRSHLKNIMRKLDVHSRAEAVATAERMRSAAATAPR